MALSFILIPLSERMLFGQALSTGVLLGGLILFCGIIVTQI
jgi:hypothetical protein